MQRNPCRHHGRPTGLQRLFAQFERLIGVAVGALFHGWDLSLLDARQTRTADGLGDPTHQYDERETMLVAQSSAVLDIGTCDGRRFARFAPFPAVAVAAESYAPNVPLAMQRLEPLGVQVVRSDENCHNSRGPQGRACTTLREALKP